MKLTEKIKNEQGIVLIDGLRKVIQDSTSKLTNFSYKVSKDLQKKINVIVEYYIMSYYSTQDIDGVTYEDLLKNIELVLSIVTDIPIYTNVVDKKYDEVLWWVIYRLFDIGDLYSEDYSSEIVTRIFDVVNCVEAGEYPESCLDSFLSIQLEECINQMYLIMMSEFMFGDKFQF